MWYFKLTQLTITLLAHMALVRFLFRVNTHVLFKYQMYEKLYRKHHIRTVSRSCEYACVFAND